MFLEQAAYPKGIQNLAGTRGTGVGGPLAALDWDWEISGLKRGYIIDLGYHSRLGVQFLARTPGASQFSSCQQGFLN